MFWPYDRALHQLLASALVQALGVVLVEDARADNGRVFPVARREQPGSWAHHGGGARVRHDAMMRVDARTLLPDDLLLYGDKISMAVALEVRVPMLDLEVERFVESLPRDFRVRLRESKLVHRRAAERRLPARIVRRRQQGFQRPFGAWIRGPGGSGSPSACSNLDCPTSIA